MLFATGRLNSIWPIRKSNRCRLIHDISRPEAWQFRNARAVASHFVIIDMSFLILRLLMFRSVAMLALSAALLNACGCGPQEIPKVKVTGNVTLNGAPLKAGTIKFIPQSGDGPTTGAVLNGEGEYSTEVPAGLMRVEITSPKVTGKRKLYDTPDSPMIEITEEQIPHRYNSKSELKYEVSSDEKEVEADFDLTSEKK